ncbi:pantetheine-phosphate adenylyltransferase [Nanoarchaeota archaeon]
MAKGVYAGSFDPLTNGHLWMIHEGSRLFTHLVVAVGANPDKRSRFSTSERTRMIRGATEDLSHVTADSFSGKYLVQYAADIGAEYILRGIRSPTDADYERNMRHINHDLDPNIGTVFLMPPREIAEVSSSMVKGLIGPERWKDVVERYVPPNVHAMILEKYS